jgi:hypothetical protein
MSVGMVIEPDTQSALGAGTRFGVSANGPSSPERSVLLMSRLKAFWRLLNLPCQGMCRLTSDSLDHDLGRLGRFALRSHLLCYTSCRRFERQIRFLRFAMRRFPGQVEDGELIPGTYMPDEVRERISRALTREDLYH